MEGGRQELHPNVSIQIHNHHVHNQSQLTTTARNKLSKSIRERNIREVQRLAVQQRDDIGREESSWHVSSAGWIGRDTTQTTDLV